MKSAIVLAFAIGILACGDAGTAPDNTPATPANVTVSALADGKLQLTWTQPTQTGISYQIERRIGEAGTFALIGTVSSSATPYVDDVVEPGKTYCYRVRAAAGANTSDYSTTACATPAIPPLGAWVIRTSMPTARQEMPGATIMASSR